MPLSELIYITMGQIVLGIGVLTLITITLSTHVSYKKVIKKDIEKQNRILNKLNMLEVRIDKSIVNSNVKTEKENKDIGDTAVEKYKDHQNGNNNDDEEII